MVERSKTNEDENKRVKERWNERVARLSRPSKTSEGREERLLESREIRE